MYKVCVLLCQAKNSMPKLWINLKVFRLLPLNYMSQRIYITIKKNDSYLSRNGLGDTIFCLGFKLPPQRFALYRCNQCSWRWNLHVEQFMFVINRSSRHFSILKRGEMFKMEGFLSTAHDKIPCINKHFYWLCAYYPFSTFDF